MYCSRYNESPIATLNGRPRKLSVNQLGLGNEPTIAVGSMVSFVATNIGSSRSVRLAHHTSRLPAGVNQFPSTRQRIRISAPARMTVLFAPCLHELAFSVSV